VGFLVSAAGDAVEVADAGMIAATILVPEVAPITVPSASFLTVSAAWLFMVGYNIAAMPTG
jgi:hypothetical protein